VFTFQVGANSTADNQITITTSDVGTAMGTNTQGAAATLGTTAAEALTAMDNIDAALTEVNSARSTYGAAQNRFEAVISGLQVASENQAAARSRIMDADFAAETVARADPAAGGHGDGGAGQPAAPAGAAAAADLSTRWIPAVAPAASSEARVWPIPTSSALLSPCRREQVRATCRLKHRKASR
jgi:hypothetical protein